MNPATPGGQSISIGEATLSRYPHACAFFATVEDQYAFTVPLVLEGLAAGDKAVHIVDPTQRLEHRSRLGQAGVDVEGAEAARQLEVATWDDTYLSGGSFDPDAMLTLLEALLERSQAEGFLRTRVIGRMEWAHEDRPGVDRLIEYEARVNEVLGRHHQLAVCAYDMSRLSAVMMVDVLRTHPMIVIGTTLYENPFFVEPGQFLEELAERGSAR